MKTKTHLYASGLIVFLAFSFLIIWGSHKLLTDGDHITTDQGVNCIVNYFGSPVSCNWEAWNMKTNFGMYPEKAFDK